MIGISQRQQSIEELSFFPVGKKFNIALFYKFVLKLIDDSEHVQKIKKFSEVLFDVPLDLGNPKVKRNRNSAKNKRGHFFIDN